jgi:uncharacterized protein
MSKTSTLGTALITGASRGIGAIYASRLAARGYDLVLVARDASRLQTLADRLARESGRVVSALPADLNDKADLARVEATLRDDAGITLLVNNAGLGAVTPLVATDVDKMQRLIELNVTALTRLVYAAAPAFVQRKAGTIINIASIVGIAPEILNGVYGATKAYVVALTHSLQHELADKGVRVQAVLPGAIATDFWETAGKHYDQLPAGIVMSPENVVDAALAGLDQGEVITLPSLHDSALWARFETARGELAKRLSNGAPAPRYQLRVPAHA